MQLELIDVLYIFTSGLSLGFLIGHWFGVKSKDLEYERGKCDGINLVWPYLVRSLWESVRSSQHAADKASGAGSSPQPPVH